MSNRNHLMIFTAMLALAGCSSALSQESENTAITTQSGPDVAGTYDVQAPVDAPLLDGAPLAALPESYAPEAREPKPAPKLAPAYRQSRLECDIDIDRTANGIRITPVVHSDRKLSGEYSLVITKSGGGNSSDITQGGPFDASRGESVRLGSSEFSMERGAKFRATLKVRAGGREICRDVRS
jgi:hypothetical protein